MWNLKCCSKDWTIDTTLMHSRDQPLMLGDKVRLTVRSGLSASHVKFFYQTGKSIPSRYVEIGGGLLQTFATNDCMLNIKIFLKFPCCRKWDINYRYAFRLALGTSVRLWGYNYPVQAQQWLKNHWQSTVGNRVVPVQDCEIWPIWGQGGPPIGQVNKDATTLASMNLKISIIWDL